MWYKQSGFVNSTPTSVKEHLSTEQGMLYREYPCNCEVGSLLDSPLASPVQFQNIKMAKAKNVQTEASERDFTNQ